MPGKSCRPGPAYRRVAIDVTFNSRVVINVPEAPEIPATAWLITYFDKWTGAASNIHSIREVDFSEVLWTFTGCILKPSEET